MSLVNPCKQIIYIDMDGVLVDLESEINYFISKNQQYNHIDWDLIPNVFRNPKPIVGAIEAVTQLIDSNLFDIYIATTSPWNNPQSACDKICWIQAHFNGKLDRKVIITHHKHLLQGDFLIDDREHNGKKFKGTFIHFGSSEYPDWNSVLSYLKKWFLSCSIF